VVLSGSAFAKVNTIILTAGISSITKLTVFLHVSAFNFVQAGEVHGYLEITMAGHGSN